MLTLNLMLFMIKSPGLIAVMHHTESSQSMKQSYLLNYGSQKTYLLR